MSNEIVDAGLSPEKDISAMSSNTSDISKDASNTKMDESFNPVGIASEDEADESDECGVEYLLHRNTPSFRCLAQVAVSNSSLMKEKLYHFPPLVDAGIDEAYFYQSE